MKTNNKKSQVIQDFIAYLRQWETGAKEQKVKCPVSASTMNGLKVTLGGILELVQYLHVDCNYEYLMTIRAVQDPLEVCIVKYAFTSNVYNIKL